MIWTTFDASTSTPVSALTINLTAPCASRVQLRLSAVPNVGNRSTLAGGRIIRADKQVYKLYNTKTLTRPCESTDTNDLKILRSGQQHPNTTLILRLSSAVSTFRNLPAHPDTPCE